MMKHAWRPRPRHWISLALMLLACSGGEDDRGTASGEPDTCIDPPCSVTCTPGATVPCFCSDGTSATQTCLADGQSLSLCGCGNVGPPGSGGNPTGSGGIPSAGGAAGVSGGGLGTTGGAPSGGGLPDAGPPTTGGAGADAEPPAGGLMPPANLEALAGSTTVGLEWDPVEGATGYRVYWSESPGVSPAAAAGSIDAAPGFIHEGLVNGVTYHYVVVALDGAGESAASPEVAATPAGEFVLERFGVGIVPDFRSDALYDVPISDRVHVVIVAEGYQTADLPQFEEDVDDWQQDVFAVNPFDTLNEGIVVWKLGRPSTDHVPGTNTAFRVATVGGGTGVGDISDEVGTLLWSALASFPVPLRSGPFSGNFGEVTLNLVASFLIYDPRFERAGLSGRATSLQNPDGDGRVWAAFARGHAHEFAHAFGRLADEYLDLGIQRSDTRETSNVAATNVCSELPWQHLLAGGAINPDTDQLVGAFGRDGLGYHSELLCLINGTHDNADFYGGNGLLRVEDRLCNFCRELTAFRAYERLGIITGFDTWQTEYRSAFFDSQGFSVPAMVPQANNQGETYYEACVQ